MHSSASGVICSAQMNAVGNVVSLLNSEISARPLISARLRVVDSSMSYALRYIDLMGGGPDSLHWSRPWVNAANIASASPAFSNIMLNE